MDSSSFSYPCSCNSTSLTAGNNGNEKKKKVGGMKLSTDPQSVAARQRRHRISDRFKILQGLVPGGLKMDTVSMLEEAIQYVKFLKTQIWLHQATINLLDNAADDPTSNFLTNSCEFFPFYYQIVDSCNYYSGYQVQADMAGLGLPESWFPGDEINGSSDPSMQS